MKNHRALLVVATPTSRTLGGLFDVTASADRQQRVWELQLARHHRGASGLNAPIDDSGGSFQGAPTSPTVECGDSRKRGKACLFPATASHVVLSRSLWPAWSGR